MGGFTLWGAARRKVDEREGEEGAERVASLSLLGAVQGSQTRERGVRWDEEGLSGV